MAAKKVWITGASGGIGAALALEYAHRGAALLLSARRRSELESVAAQCRSAGAPRVEVQQVDLADTAGHGAVAEQAWEQMDGFDLLVHNAGLSQRSLAADTDPLVVERIMAVNFLAPVNLTRTLLPRLRERDGARVAVVCSVTGHVSTPMRSTYAASKHAVRAYFDALRAEEHRHGVEVTLISPGFVNTNISRNSLTADGGRWERMDSGQARGMSAERCARRAVRAIERGKREVFIGGREVAGVYLARFMPGLLALLIRNIKTV